jgi:hypothetical protein
MTRRVLFGSEARLLLEHGLSGGRTRRLLPEGAYDFWAEDARDGERYFVRNTLAEAKADAREWRSELASYKRSVISVEWAVNERKVRTMLRALGALQGGVPETHLAHNQKKRVRFTPLQRKR